MLLPRNRRSLSSRTKRISSPRRISTVLDYQSLKRESRVLSDSIVVLRTALSETASETSAEYIFSPSKRRD